MKQAFGWALGAGGVFAVAVLSGAGCRQIVGIGPRAAGGDAGTAAACGLSLGAGDCQSCIDTQCCAEANACSGTPVCKSIEECYAPCGNDGACIGACQAQNPSGPLPESSSIEACISTKCGAACGLSCGLRPSSQRGDTGEACDQCIASKACAQATTCGESASCRNIMACNSGCATLDCAAACESLDDAGAAEFIDLANSLAPCTTPCGSGHNWQCVGHVTWPRPASGTNNVSFLIADPINSNPIAGAQGTLCTKLYPDCSSNLGQATSDANGMISFTYTTDTHLGGLDGFFEVTAPNHVPTLFYWNFPLSEHDASLSELKFPSQDEEATLFAAEHITPLAGYGHFGVAVFDCLHEAASDVQIRLSPSDPNTIILYGGNGTGLSADAGKTDPTGIAFAANVPAGNVDMYVTSMTTGQLVAHVNFAVKDGWVNQLFVVPTPL
ncbi:MAG TPA: hypothetical protein VGI39_19205 [Polyangiaceae bacterium]|jgi:hypothetical protein